MTKNLHIEHPEDTILTGDLDVLDWFVTPGHLSVKIDGSPAIIWGTDPSTGDFFVGTKSVFNKKKIKICYTEADVFALYGDQPALVEILCACLKYLPRGEFIYQGDFIGFGGSNEYKPNTITYQFPEVVRHTIIIAPHTEYVSSGELKDAQVVGPIEYKINGNDQVLFVQPNAYILHNQESFFDAEEVCKFARQMAQTATFVSGKQLTELKKAINACISVQDTWEEQERYLIEEKLGKYFNHYISRYEGGKVVEVWKIKGNDVITILLPKLKKDWERKINGKYKDPRLSGNITKKEIYQYGTKIV